MRAHAVTDRGGREETAGDSWEVGGGKQEHERRGGRGGGKARARCEHGHGCLHHDAAQSMAPKQQRSHLLLFHRFPRGGGSSTMVHRGGPRGGEGPRVPGGAGRGHTIDPRAGHIGLVRRVGSQHCSLENPKKRHRRRVKPNGGWKGTNLKQPFKFVLETAVRCSEFIQRNEGLHCYRCCSRPRSG